MREERARGEQMTAAEFVVLCTEMRNAGVQRFVFRGCSAVFSAEPRAEAVADEPRKDDRDLNPEDQQAFWEDTMYHSS